jgi:hypothetical protein
VSSRALRLALADKSVCNTYQHHSRGRGGTCNALKKLPLRHVFETAYGLMT